MILWKIYQALERIEDKLDHIVQREAESGEALPGTDEWMQKGLDSIMSFQAGRKRESE